MGKGKGKGKGKGVVQKIPSYARNHGNTFAAQIADAAVAKYNTEFVQPEINNLKNLSRKFFHDLGGMYVLIRSYQTLFESLGIKPEVLEEARISEEEKALKLLKVDRPAAEGDTVRAKFCGKAENQEDFGNVKDKVFTELGTGKSGLLPEIELKLVGVSAGEEIEYAHTYMQTAKNILVAGQEPPEDTECFSEVITDPETKKPKKQRYYMGEVPFVFTYKFEVMRVSEPIEPPPKEDLKEPTEDKKEDADEKSSENAGE